MIHGKVFDLYERADHEGKATSSLTFFKFSATLQAAMKSKNLDEISEDCFL